MATRAPFCDRIAAFGRIRDASMFWSRIGVKRKGMPARIQAAESSYSAWIFLQE
jgi:hypothetical protein